MKRTTYPTPQDAESAFYEAIERGDLDAMMEIWAEDEEIVCVHPTGPRLTGHDQIRESWGQIFNSGQRLQVRLTQQVYVHGMMLAIHSVHENIVTAGEARQRQVVVATNVYLRTASGWRMLVHHASPAPAAASPAARAIEIPKILH